MYTKTCAMCGKTFETKYKKAMFCKGPHYMTCPVCGKTFQVDNRIAYCYHNKDKVCCSRTCGLKLGFSKQTAEQRKAKSDKAKHTKLERYGDENYNNPDKFKETNLKRYGVENPMSNADIRSKAEQTKVKRYGSATYNNRQQAAETCLQRYGVDNAAKSEQAKEKSRKTNFERRGVEYSFQSEDVKQKTKETVRRKYGVDHVMQSDEVQQVRKQRSLLKHGVPSPTMLDSTKVKTRNSMVSKYGGWYTSTEEYREKVRKTSHSKYGTNNPQQSEAVKNKRQRTNLKRYGTPCALQNESVKAKSLLTILRKYGVNHPSKCEEVRDRVRKTTKRHYGVEYPLQSERVQQRVKATNVLRYGTSHPMQNSQVVDKNRRTCQARYGVDSVMKVPEIRHRQARSARVSNLEARVATLLNSYNISYTTQYVLRKGDFVHSFDFYVPNYKVLMDADGVYYHSYLSDPDGKFVGDYYDMVRLSLVPKDHVFVVAVEGHEDKAVKELHDVIKRMDSGAFDYDTELFQWCRQVGFPYPSYTVERMTKDWNSLCKYESETYKPNARLGMSLIKNFHKSMYDARVGSCVSVREAWEDDTLLRKVIENRLIYKNNVDPSKVLQGFNISKTCPTVSVFNPVLAKYLTENYLSNFDTVFDPFSGFSGRLLGVCSTGRKYLGQDLKSRAVRESNEIVQLLNLIGSSVSNKDVLSSSDTYPCLLTCPPYGRKETYAQEATFKPCDEWIDECIKRFRCKRYVFVVDKTSKYENCVVETLTNKSHLYKTSEYVVVIDRH